MNREVACKAIAQSPKKSEILLLAIMMKAVEKEDFPRFCRPIVSRLVAATDEEDRTVLFVDLLDHYECSDEDLTAMSLRLILDE